MTALTSPSFALRPQRDGLRQKQFSLSRPRAAGHSPAALEPSDGGGARLRVQALSGNRRHAVRPQATVVSRIMKPNDFSQLKVLTRGGFCRSRSPLARRAPSQLGDGARRSTAARWRRAPGAASGTASARRCWSSSAPAARRSGRSAAPAPQAKQPWQRAATQRRLAFMAAHRAQHGDRRRRCSPASSPTTTTLWLEYGQIALYAPALGLGRDRLRDRADGLLRLACAATSTRCRPSRWPTTR